MEVYFYMVILPLDLLCGYNSCGRVLKSGAFLLECASNCATCSAQDTTNEPDILSCDTCNAGYAKNEAVCAGREVADIDLCNSSKY